jgi:hypothetical protein
MRPNLHIPQVTTDELLAGARITGTLDLEATTLSCPLTLLGCYLERPINLDHARAPALHLPACHVPALSGAQLETSGNLSLSRGFTAKGEVSLNGAHIGGGLDLSGATLANPDDAALFADRLTVDQGMACTQGFTAKGSLQLVGAQISGGLDFSGAQVNDQIGLSGAHVTELLFYGATLANPDGMALLADRLTVDQGMACAQGFTAKGEIYLVDAHIGGQLNFHDATLSNPAGVALDLERLRADTLILLPKTPPKGTVYLTNANVNTYSDSQATWPADLRLGGFTYGALHASPEVDATKRLRWLEHDPGGYIPQLYEQLAAAYRKAGRDEDARKVAIAKQRRRRQVLHPASKVWNSLLYWTVGYGYRTWQAVLWLLGFLLVSWVVFARAYPAYMTPTKKPRRSAASFPAASLRIGYLAARG